MGEIPADWVRIRELTDEQAFTLAFLENEDRESLNEMERGTVVGGGGYFIYKVIPSAQGGNTKRG